MTNQQEWVFDEIDSVIRTCCGAMFGPERVPSAWASPEPGTEVRATSPDLFSFIDFEGPDVRGMLVLRQRKQDVLASHPLPRLDRSDADALDWASERANQVAGRIANRLNVKGVSIQIGLPATVYGRTNDPVCDFDPPARFVLTYEGESVRAYLCARVRDPNSATDDPPVRRSTSEGAILLF
jgi:hypothetical protein